MTDNALVDGLLDEVMKGRAARVAHDLDAVRLGGHRLLELADHGLRRPSRELRLDLHTEGFRGFLRARLTRERRPVAWVAAHLHVHHQALADRIGRSRHRSRREPRRGDADQKKLDQTHVRFSLAYSGRLAGGPSLFGRAPPPNLPNDRRLAKNACRRCGSSTYM